MTTTGTGHESYLLRLWRPAGARPWRASVQCAVTGEVVRFSDPGALCAYLAGDLHDPHADPRARYPRPRSTP